MGKTIPDNDEIEFRQRLKKLQIDYNKLKSDGLIFELAQVAYWDEYHIKQVAGTYIDETLIFSPIEDGLYDNEREFDKESNQKDPMVE